MDVQLVVWVSAEALESLPRSGAKAFDFIIYDFRSPLILLLRISAAAASPFKFDIGFTNRTHSGGPVLRVKTRDLLPFEPSL